MNHINCARLEASIQLGAFFFFFFFFFFAQNLHCGYTLAPPRRGVSNEYLQCMFWIKNKKMGIPLHTTVLLYKKDLRGIHNYISWICFPDG